MLSHDQVWTAIDALAARHSLSASGLAKRAGLDSGYAEQVLDKMVEAFSFFTRSTCHRPAHVRLQQRIILVQRTQCAGNRDQWRAQVVRYGVEQRSLQSIGSL